jgi:PAS domain S-box-containing protein
MPIHPPSPKTPRAKESSMPGRENDFQDILMNAPIGFSTAAPDGRILFANPALARMLGYETPAELIDSDIAERLHASAPEGHFGRAGGPTDTGAREFRLPRRDGIIIWVSGNTRIVRDAEGNISHTQTFISDITERKRIEEALQAREKKTSNPAWPFAAATTRN